MEKLRVSSLLCNKRKEGKNIPETTESRGRLRGRERLERKNSFLWVQMDGNAIRFLKKNTTSSLEMIWVKRTRKWNEKIRKTSREERTWKDRGQRTLKDPVKSVARQRRMECKVHMNLTKGNWKLEFASSSVILCRRLSSRSLVLLIESSLAASLFESVFQNFIPYSSGPFVGNAWRILEERIPPFSPSHLFLVLFTFLL